MNAACFRSRIPFSRPRCGIGAQRTVKRFLNSHTASDGPLAGRLHVVQLDGGQLGEDTVDGFPKRCEAHLLDGRSGLYMGLCQ